MESTRRGGCTFSIVRKVRNSIVQGGLYGIVVSLRGLRYRTALCAAVQSLGTAVPVEGKGPERADKAAGAS
jgi:hypothetical protein